MVNRVGCFLNFTDSYNSDVHLNIKSIVYIVHDDDNIIISTDHNEWYLNYDIDLFIDIINIVINYD